MATQTALTIDQLKELAAAITQGIPTDLPADRAQALIGKKKELHERIRLALTSLQWPPILAPDRKFAPGVLDLVQALGGQFAAARLTTTPVGDTLPSQRDQGVIKFRTDWHWKSEEKERLSISPSVGTEVIYLTDLLEDSLGCTFETVEGVKSMQAILQSLPQVPNLRWVVSSTPTINRVLANHLQETGQYLLPTVYTWTTDTYQYPGEALNLLLVGFLVSGGVGVIRQHPQYGLGNIGLFVLGVPA